MSTKSPSEPALTAMGQMIASGCARCSTLERMVAVLRASMPGDWASTERVNASNRYLQDWLDAQELPQLHQHEIHAESESAEKVETSTDGIIPEGDIGVLAQREWWRTMPCSCGCGQVIEIGPRYASAACRQAAKRARDG